jgi:hypothetical protein
MQIIRGNYEDTRTIQAKRKQVQSSKIHGDNCFGCRVKTILGAVTFLLVAWALYFILAALAYALA